MERLRHDLPLTVRLEQVEEVAEAETIEVVGVDPRAGDTAHDVDGYDAHSERTTASRRRCYDAW